MPAPGVPAAEYRIDESLVRTLLRAQCPQFANEEIAAVGEGWDNAMFRIGAALAVRLPRRKAAAPLLEKEQKFLPEIAATAASDIQVPEHIFHGSAACGYPWRWSVVRWLAGTPSNRAAIEESEGERLGSFLRALHAPGRRTVPPRNAYRGVPLRGRAADMEQRIRRLRETTGLLTEKVLRMWSEALDAPPAEASVWIHGDMHPGNVLVENGRITGIIDWGDLTSGDAATDLAALWSVLDSTRARAFAMSACGRQPAATWARARGWAALFALVLLDTEDGRHIAMGRKILQRLHQGNGASDGM